MKRDTTFAFEIHHHEDTAQEMDCFSVRKVSIPEMIATVKSTGYFSKKTKWLAIQSFFRGKFAACWEHAQNITAYSQDDEYYYDGFIFFPIYHDNGKEFLKLSGLRKARTALSVLENLKDVGGYVLLEDVMKCFPVPEMVNEDSGGASKKY